MVHITSDKKPKIEGYFERYVKDLLNRAFTNPQFFTISETAKYKPYEDPDIWNQARGKKPEIVEVYYKNEFICDVYSNMSRDEIINKVWRIMLKKRELKVREKNDTNTTSS